jgi:aspartate kinase
MIVMKFGGTSVKDAEAILRVANIVKSQRERGFIVVSAFATITNSIVNIISALRNFKMSDVMKEITKIGNYHRVVVSELNLHEELNKYIDDKINELTQFVEALNILGEVTPKSSDLLLAFGETLSSYIIYHAFLKIGISVKYYDSKLLIKTDSIHNEANVDFKISNNLIKNCSDEYLRDFQFIITQGFIASNNEGHITTLGRGGSDYSAAIIASAIAADKLEIWTDVNGVLTSDPKIIKEALLVKTLSYKEAAEIAYFGAKVLHPKTIYPAIKKGIPVYVLNSFKPEIQGTKIISDKGRAKIIKAIAFRKGIIVINIHSSGMLGAYGFLYRVFEIFKKYETPVDLVTTSEVSISLTIDSENNLSAIVDELKKFATISIKRGQAILSAIGEGIRDTAGIAARFFTSLKGINISMVSIGASEVNLSIIVSEKDLEQAVKLLHTEFFSGKLNPDIFEKID